jgi:Arc/MetJ-type ribon-helix-helix transcriptional regulator
MHQFKYGHLEWSARTVFDKASRDENSVGRTARRRRIGPEDERIALRCNQKELRMVDTFVASGEFRNRSELMREALRSFLRSRSVADVVSLASLAPTDAVEVPVRLRPEEVERYTAYGALVGNQQPLGDTLAQLVRRGDLELKVTELVQHARESVRRATQVREHLGELRDASQQLARKGVVGR